MAPICRRIKLFDETVIFVAFAQHKRIGEEVSWGIFDLDRLTHIQLVPRDPLETDTPPELFLDKKIVHSLFRDRGAGLQKVCELLEKRRLAGELTRAWV